MYVIYPALTTQTLLRAIPGNNVWARETRFIWTPLPLKLKFGKPTSI